MKLFLSRHLNKVDQKGRVSVPSQFRAVMSSEDFQGIVVYKSLINDCIEGCAMSRLETIGAGIDQLDPFSLERDAFATTVLGSSIQLPFDGEGRVVLPKDLASDFDISGSLMFVGKGQTFEMWQPDKFNDYFVKAQRLAMENRSLLKLPTQNNRQID